ncbi:hypothetical protein [Arthrobacter sp. Leaf69]|uniref:hypothetical protein n=1 Tax=Arthrobacter sp. Leaf69 TaxID=1736232 RepID=UPI000A7C8BE5|nr:hypothetical protein [Arthrobacter sp. Leaf69]
MSSASPRSAGLGVPPRKDRRAGALVRYVFAATLVRSADGGAVVAIVLLAHACGMPGWLAGLLGASITAPHLCGPFIARRLDTARDGRKVIASSAVLHGVLLGAAALLLPIAWPVWPAMLLFASGIFGPMLTGGISSRLPSIAGPEQRSQRRAQSWDVASYGLSGPSAPQQWRGSRQPPTHSPRHWSWPEPPSSVREPSSHSPSKSHSTRQSTCHRPDEH